MLEACAVSTHQLKSLSSCPGKNPQQIYAASNEIVLGGISHGLLKNSHNANFMATIEVTAPI
jgi:hypothetical protein